MIKYSVLIRTFNCERTLRWTLEFLAGQTWLPAEYVVVDSGSTDGTLAQLPAESIVHRYVGGEFNYSEALNQGLALVSNEYVLIVSSHTVLGRPAALEYALTLLQGSPHIGAAYFSQTPAAAPEHKLIDNTNFNGFNGLWNTCSLIKMPLLKKRSFRSEVFSAEDQEWARWLLTTERKKVARINGCELRNINPRKNSSQKRLNEYVSIAYFSNRNLLKVGNLLALAKQALLPSDRRDGGETRMYYVRLIVSLVSCWFYQPQGKSKYF